MDEIRFWLALVVLVILVAGALAGWTFIYLYNRWENWRLTQAGQHLMYFTTATFVIMTIIIVDFYRFEDFLIGLGAVGVSFVMIQRLWLLIQTHKRASTLVRRFGGAERPRPLFGHLDSYETDKQRHDREEGPPG